MYKIDGSSKFRESTARNKEYSTFSFDKLFIILLITAVLPLNRLDPKIFVKNPARVTCMNYAYEELI